MLLLLSPAELTVYLISVAVFMIGFLYVWCVGLFAMAYTCTTCDAEFESAAAVTQHLPLHHNTCAVCNEEFGDTDSLREHVHETH